MSLQGAWTSVRAQIAQVVMITANGDVGNLIAQAMEKVGNEG